MTGIADLERDLRILASDYGARVGAQTMAIMSYGTGSDVPEEHPWCLRLYKRSRPGGAQTHNGKAAYMRREDTKDGGLAFYAYSPAEAILKASHWVKSGGVFVVDNGAIAEAAE